ncbi:MAG: hypothetical protein GEV07_19850 [Streptosporangiales bacterium]|nr:hypothetical protein [Streptosporangiales bacterium]
MELEHEFAVPVSVAEAWQVLLDVERIGPCMPGATVLDVRGDEFTGTVKVKVGPISMTYAGEARFAEKDEAARRVVIEAAGKENRGSGTAKASVTATLEPADGGSSTAVKVLTDLTVTGRPAQFGRGMLQDVGGKLIGQFADNLAAELQEDDKAGAAAPAATSGESEPSPASTPQAMYDEAGQRPSAEALDLLEVTGLSGAMSRYRVPLLAGGAAVGAALVWFLVRRKRSR